VLPLALDADRDVGGGAAAVAGQYPWHARVLGDHGGADGTGRVIVQLTDPRTPVNVRQEANQVVVDFAGTLMPNFDAAEVPAKSTWIPVSEIVSVAESVTGSS